MAKKVNRQAFKLATYCYEDSSVLRPSLVSCSIYFSHGEFCFLYVQYKLFDISLCVKITNYHVAYYCYKDSSVVKVSFFQILNSTYFEN